MGVLVQYFLIVGKLTVFKKPENPIFEKWPAYGRSNISFVPPNAARDYLFSDKNKQVLYFGDMSQIGTDFCLAFWVPEEKKIPASI